MSKNELNNLSITIPVTDTKPLNFLAGTSVFKSYIHSNTGKTVDTNSIK